MSTTATITLCSAIAVTLGIVGYVHYKQKSDRDKLHDGVIKDVERQQRRKVENTYILQQQIDLAKKLRNELNKRQLTDIKE